MISIHPFGHHSYDEVNHLIAENPYLLAIHPQAESHEPVLPYVQHAVLAEIHDGPHLLGYLLDPRKSLPVPVEHRQYVEGLPNVQLGMASIPHHEREHHEYEQSYEHHEVERHEYEHQGEGHHGGVLHELADDVFGHEHHRDREEGHH